MKPPEKIYLQCYGEDGELLDAATANNEVTWCVDQINENDAVYVLAQAQEENRVRGECLAEAIGALEYIKNALPGTTEMAISALDKIEHRLAQLEPEEEER